MRRSPHDPTAACLYLLPVLLAAAAPGGAEYLELAGGRVELQSGVLTGAANRLTGEAYTTPSVTGLDTGILRSRTEALWAADASGRGAEATPAALDLNAQWEGGSRLATRVAVEADSGELVIRQEGSVEGGGLYGCQWALRGLDDDEVSVIVPAWSGVRLDHDAPVTDAVFDWPSSWEARMVIVQGRRGGLWIRADDPDDRFKGLAIRHHDGCFDLGFRTYTEGPPTEHGTVESVTWRVAFYEGDWRVPARQYREWMAQTFGTPALADRRPEWASSIRSVVILSADRDPSQRDEVRATLRKLTDWVTPSKCLLYVPNWRRDRYDINYPDYTACDGFADLVAFAHELGYRVMPHTCYYGVNLENPDYEALKPYHMRDAFSGEPITYVWQWADPEPHIAMIHPGAQAWRDLYVRKCRDIVAQYGADALHLDVTLSMPNVAARADGLNTIEGNVAFHRDLREALPDVALGGEGLNEVSCRHEAFAQTHGLLAVNHPGGQPQRVYNPAGGDCSHPISAYLLSPFTAWYGYLGYPSPAPSQLYRGWTHAYESWGVLPTLSRPESAQLADPGPDLRVRLEEMRLIDRYDMRPDLDAEASPTTECVWTGREGSRLVYEADGSGGSHVWFRAPSGERRTVYRYLRGRTSAQVEGRVDGWPAYDAAGVCGLDPDRLHLLEPGAPDLGRPRVCGLPEDVILRGFRCTDRFMLLDLGLRERGVDLAARVCDAAVGITLEGEDRPLGSRAQFAAGYATVGGESKRGFSVHPPWDPGPGVIGTVYAEWELAVPEGQSRLEFAVGLRDGAEESDGVTFRVEADGREVFRQDWKRCEWRPCRVDLAEFSGRTVRLRLSVDKGPEGRGSFAWAAWGEPRVASDAGSLEFPMEALTPAEVPAPLQPPGCVRLGKQGRLSHYRALAEAPGALCLLLDQPAPASLPLDLLQTPFSWTPVIGGVPMDEKTRPAYVGASVGVGTAGGVERPALAVHPPIGGATVVDYVLALPAGAGAALSTSVAVQDGAKGTNGVDFAVAVNGSVQQRVRVEGADGWHPMDVDLAPWAGQTLVLSLIADARDDAVCDWARWAQPVIG